MKVVTLKDIPNLPVEGAERIEGWSGPVSRSRQTIIEPGDSGNYNCSVVNFSQGCTTGWHTHTCDQILVVFLGFRFRGNDISAGVILQLPSPASARGAACRGRSPRPS